MKINFEKAIIRKMVTTRGGGVEIDLRLFGFPGERMSAYQNYLGGGLLGRVCENNTIEALGKSVSDKDLKKLHKIAEELKKYYHSLTNPDSEWEGMSYDQNQKLNARAY